LQLYLHDARQYSTDNRISNYQEEMMESKVSNPWTWQEQFGFVHAVEVQGAQRVLYCAGQLPTGAEGQLLHEGDLRGQVILAFDNLEKVLQEAGFNLADVVRLNYYTTDVDQLLGNWDVIVNRLTAAGCHCTSTLLGVARLAYPQAMIEIEATAVK
jgi:enamine deaminase RidA (YjgF/YER057c/UK114 family)